MKTGAAARVADLRGELAVMERRLIAAAFRQAVWLVSLVVAANTATVFGLLKLLLPA